MFLFRLTTRSLVILAMVYRAYKRRSLTPLGILAAILTGVVHSLHPWSVFLFLLLAFYVSGTIFTGVNADRKKLLTVSPDAANEDQSEDQSPETKDDGYETDGEGESKDEGKPKHSANIGKHSRTHIQVLANSVVASVLIVIHLVYCYFTYGSFSVENLSDRVTQKIFIGIVAQYAAVNADTWSSELGILSTENPILITTLRPCRKGTNGGISVLGLQVAILGGFYIGVFSCIFCPFIFMDWSVKQIFRYILFISSLGLFGSLCDSVLGALYQSSVVNEEGVIIEVPGGGKLSNDEEKKFVTISGKNVLSNNQVNLAMAAITSVVAMIVW
ncbi:hypothetical protein NADFUDRAFT_40626 [Nadsonia fulvescens var. elongata DSM 6958]|uniref:DUF92-domain-containing protein n=1 Tax=Nadsonia fulvescens var. elongata DSM 6958 TaxID=857566 RepID=A0A1E3PPV6_9ASCO|nr:hypothetical protein NADFUDRAFT_40626 [Nadsonia fulvescens var. elongata DSM 6958]